MGRGGTTTELLGVFKDGLHELFDGAIQQVGTSGDKSVQESNVPAMTGQCHDDVLALAHGLQRQGYQRQTGEFNSSHPSTLPQHLGNTGTRSIFRPASRNNLADRVNRELPHMEATGAEVHGWESSVHLGAPNSRPATTAKHPIVDFAKSARLKGVF